MALPPPLPNPHTRGLQTAGGGRIELALQQQMGRDLLDMLQPGQVLSGRVVERFANGSYLFTLRGRNLIADSSIPLARDSVVQFQVLESSDGLRLRLLDGSGLDRAQTTSDIGNRLQQLGLPDNQAARLLLAGFEQSQAPLSDSSRLQHALQQISQAPPARQPIIAAAHALLAKAGLPATPALIALAERAAGGQLPDPAAAVRHLAQAAQQLTTPLATNTNTAGQTGSPAGGISPQASAAPPPLSPQAPPQPTSSAPLPGPAPQGGGETAPVPLAAGQGTIQTGPMGQLDALIQQLRGIALQLGDSSAATEGRLTKEPGAGQAAQAGQATAKEAPVSHAAQIERDLGLQHALRQEATTVARLALQHPDSPPELRHAAVTVAQEMSADLLLRPAQLDDYDLVLPLAMQQQGQSRSPARMAVAHRQTRSGETMTFLRVDLELEGLGPLSLRFNAGQAGVIAITLFATGIGLEALRGGTEELQGDLQRQGLDVSLRIGDLLEELSDG